MVIRRGTQLVENGAEQVVIEFVFTGYIVSFFKGLYRSLVFVIKYKQDGACIRTPKHNHWVVDIFMKMQGNAILDKKYL